MEFPSRDDMHRSWFRPPVLTMDQIQIIIADDDPAFRRCLSELLARDAGLKVVATTADGQSALARILELRPQIALVDISMPGMDGFELARAVSERKLPTRIIFVTMFDDEEMRREAAAAGGYGYVLKDTAVLHLVDTIRAVAAGLPTDSR